MNWIIYYRLLEKYNDNLKKATEKEIKNFYKNNLINPHSARALAEKKWKEKNNQ